MVQLKSLSSSVARVRFCVQTVPTLTPRRPFASRCLLQNHTPSNPRPWPNRPHVPLVPCSYPQVRTHANRTTADKIIEEIQEQYATAKDEFEIAHDETERKTIYAADDRAAAREELDNLKVMYDEALEGPEGEEVKRRVGQRIRELENAVEAMEKSALED